MSEEFTTFKERGQEIGQAQHFLLAAITRMGIGMFEMPLSVQMIVNGVEVPFSATIEDIYERFHNECDERIEANNRDVSEQHNVVSFEKLKTMTLQEIAEMLIYN